MYKYVVAHDGEMLLIKLFKENTKIGIAKLFNDTDTLHLLWIEIEDKYKGKGMGTMLMNYITDAILGNDQNFQINVVDEQTLPFYYSFFEKKNIDKDTIYDWVQEGENHPEIYVAKGNIKNAYVKSASPLPF